jgi:hypothetical protein
MSADIIQFIPKPNPNRDVAVALEGDGGSKFYWPWELPPRSYAADTAPIEYVAPADDCA